ncbi:hypothetical protein DFH06DRAFT_1466212 [Mycena polygramma]|nr:hypothetical protein DFH06DRAFT_1466212 [Mycena polygramma]
MRSLGKPIALFLIPLAVFTASVASVRMGCPPSDEEGSALDTQSFATKKQKVQCFYTSGSRCTYSLNGTVDVVESTDPSHICPEKLVQVTTASSPSQLPTLTTAFSSSLFGSSPPPPSAPTSTISSPSPPSSAPTRTVPRPSVATTKLPAVIAGIALSVVSLVGIVLFVICRRRRRRRRTSQSHPCLDEEQNIPPDSGNLMSEEGNRATEVVVAVAGTSAPSNEIQHGNEEPPNNRVEGEGGGGETRRDETLTERMHRVEAQMDALLTMGLSGSAPPSYKG